MTRIGDIGLDLSCTLGWQEAPWDLVDVSETPTALATSMPIADLASAAQGLVGLAAAEMHRARGAPRQSVSVDRWEASLSMTQSAYLTVNGEKAVSWDPLTGYHQAADGWVYTHCQFAHLRDRLLGAFGLPNDPSVVKKAFKCLLKSDIENRAAAAGVCAVALRSRGEWLAHPHGKHLQNKPVATLNRQGDVPARELQLGDAPLSGIRVLDLSRVIAGPMIGRTLAEHGANVIRIGAAHLPSFDSLVINTGFGKRSAFIDLRTPDGRETLAMLVRDADVLIDGYRPGALAGKGFSFDQLRALNPSIIHITLSAFGEDGPWGGRRGYDTYVQATTGLSADGSDGPTRLPCQPLDYLGGYIGAALAMIALRRRMDEGGAWQGDLALARNAEWIWQWAERLPSDDQAPPANPSLGEVTRISVRMDSAFGRLSALRPARHLTATPPRLPSAPVPLGTHPPTWT